MQKVLNKKIATGYKNNSQKVRVMSEIWAEENIFCPNCGSEISNFENNRPVASFYFKNCDETYYIDYQKPISQNDVFVKKIFKGGYYWVLNKVKFLEKHSKVISTYMDIISYDKFYNNLLDLNNSNFNPFIKDNKRITGWIKTKDGEKVNYLKVKKISNSNHLTFYGNTDDNIFDCDEENICEFYGWKGDDEYYQEKFKPDFIIKDFGKRNEKDKLYIKKGFNEINPVYGGLDGYGEGTQIQIKYTNSERKIFLEGINKDEVDEWLQILNNELPESYKKKGKTIFDIPELKRKNPIQIE